MQIFLYYMTDSYLHIIIIHMDAQELYRSCIELMMSIQITKGNRKCLPDDHIECVNHSHTIIMPYTKNNHGENFCVLSENSYSW